MKVPKGLQEVLKLEPYFVVSKGVQMSEYNITEVKFAQNHTSGEEKELSLEIVFVRRYVDLWTYQCIQEHISDVSTGLCLQV